MSSTASGTNAIRWAAVVMCMAQLLVYSDNLLPLCSLLFCLVPIPRFVVFATLVGQCDSTIERVWQPPMPSANHHGTNDQLTEDIKVSTETRQVRRMTQRQPDVTVCGDDFKENGPHGERL